ncbi:DUF2837 family protein [bacterium]|nr:DUF2837 family protein [bacterium]
MTKMTHSLIVVGFFTTVIHLTESLAYSMRLAGVRTRQIAVSLSFVTSTLLISRLSNMFQAPLLGTMVDSTVMMPHANAIHILEMQFRWIILCGFLGSFLGFALTPTMVQVFAIGITKFSISGSVPRLAISFFSPRRLLKFIKMLRVPSVASLHTISVKRLPKTPLILNAIVTSVYTIGVLCSLLAGAMLPEFRSTANQLSGIVNGIATILFTLFVDPAGARVTDQAIHGIRPEADVRSTVFFLQFGRLFGTLVLSQVLLMPFTHYILWVTRILARWAM